MATLKFADSHNMVAFLSKPAESEGFEQIVDFLNAHPISMVRNLDNLVDEAVHKELGDSLVRAATTASSLEVEQDSGNITKTQSKATPNESSSLGTTSGGGPRCQETIEILLLELVLDLEQTKTTQQNEIDSLKRRVKKLKKKDRENEKVAEEVVDAAQVSTAVTTVTITTEEITLAQAFEALKTSKPKVKGIVFQEPAKIDDDHQLAKRLQAQEQEEFSDAKKATLFQQLLEKRRKHFAAKRAEEKRNKLPTKAQQRHIIYFKTELVKGKEKRAGEELIQESSKKQKVDDDKEITKLKQCLEIILDKEEVTINAIPLAVKSPRIVD
ncbi:hypothetical protein Tco_1422705 [Tanacetum coccineum]